MTYNILEIFSDDVADDIFLKLKKFCQSAFDENKHEARKNMDVEGWESNNASLLYLLLMEKRFTKDSGGLQLLLESDEIVAVSGFYRSDFEPGVYLMGVRSWVLKDHRFNLLIANYLLPYQLQQIKSRGGHTAAISFNESTQSFARLIKRTNEGRSKTSSSRLKFFFGENYPELYKDMVLWEKPVKIKGVKQWVLVKKLSESAFDFNTINWID